jgi:tetratricopeptide (TPR) repeat protein
MLVLLGEIDARSGRIKEATERYKSAVEADRSNAEAHYKLGTAMLAENRMSEAVEEFRLAARLRPDDPVFQNALGRVFERMLRFPDAEAAYHRALVLSPEREDYRLDLEAVRKMMKGRETDPEAAKGAFAKGVALERQGRLLEASAAYQEAISHVAGFHAAYHRAGLCMAAYSSGLKKYDQMRHYLEQAAEHFRAALTQRPRHEPYMFDLAQALRDLGQAAEAQQVYAEILQVNPRSGMAHYKLAELYAYILEDIPRARKELELAVTLGVKPESGFVPNLDRIEEELKAPPPSDEEKRAEKDAEAASSEGEILAGMGDPRGAAAAYARAHAALAAQKRQRAISARARAAWNAGRAWEKAKDLPKALEWYSKAMEDRPADRRYVDDVKRLRALVGPSQEERE